MYVIVYELAKLWRLEVLSSYVCQDCLNKITNNEPKTVTAQLRKLIDAATPVYDRVQEIYTHHHQLKST